MWRYFWGMLVSVFEYTLQWGITRWYEVLVLSVLISFLRNFHPNIILTTAIYIPSSGACVPLFSTPVSGFAVICLLDNSHSNCGKIKPQTVLFEFV